MKHKEYKKKKGELGTICRIMFMCFMLVAPKAPANVYPVTKRKAKELISKKFMEEQFEAAKKKVDAREEKVEENDV